MNSNQRAKAAVDRPADFMRRERPMEQPFGLFRAHVYTPVAHWSAEVLMPVGAMEGMSLRGEETRPGNTG